MLEALNIEACTGIHSKVVYLRECTITIVTGEIRLPSSAPKTPGADEPEGIR
jgi:hypothetical protein